MLGILRSLLLLACSLTPTPIFCAHTHTHTTEHDFPALSADDKQPLKADVALLRRKEVSKIGRFLRSNGMSNKGGPLTLSMKYVYLGLSPSSTQLHNHPPTHTILTLCTYTHTLQIAGPPTPPWTQSWSLRPHMNASSVWRSS